MKHVTIRSDYSNDSALLCVIVYVVVPDPVHPVSTHEAVGTILDKQHNPNTIHEKILTPLLAPFK